MSYILGFVIALAIMRFLLKRGSLWASKEPPMDSEGADSLLTYLILGVILGGRFGYVLFYNFVYYTQNPMDVLRIWDGGMSFHGGFIGVILAVLLYCYVNKTRLWSVADIVAISTPPGLFLGRVANFINGELWGRPTELPWGVMFEGKAAQNCPEIVGACARHPSQLYEALLEGPLLLFFLMILVYFRAFFKPGFVTGTFSFGYGLARFYV